MYNNGTEVVAASSKIEKSKFDLSFDSIFSLFDSPIFHTLLIAGAVVLAVMLLIHLGRSGAFSTCCNKQQVPIIAQPQVVQQQAQVPVQQQVPLQVQPQPVII